MNKTTMRKNRKEKKNGGINSSHPRACGRTVSVETLERFRRYLSDNEKSRLTVEKYVRDAAAFAEFLGERRLEKSETADYKRRISAEYAPASVSSMLVSLNCFLCFIGRRECRVKQVRIQRQLFGEVSRELNADEYKRLVNAAEGDRMAYILQTICETGIRISELRFITVEAVNAGQAEVFCKNKRRSVFLPSGLCKELKVYIKEQKIELGSIFVTSRGKPLDRSNIWREMKKLCAKARVAPEKVFPHNLRHLFARIFYAVKKDIVRLADVLGHSSVDTTRIYTKESGEAHRECLNKVHAYLRN